MYFPQYGVRILFGRGKVVNECTLLYIYTYSTGGSAYTYISYLG